ncbi:MAG TPA: hypothetical protein VFM10_07945, partial [Terriglobales bacterium]|nr:hypothetical protein [Terriglobales bacterium]
MGGLVCAKMTFTPMPNPIVPESENNESFDKLLSQYEQSHSRKADGSKQIEATVITVTGESVILDI